VFFAKLVFGTLAFLLIGYLGSSPERRVAGVMLAFPVLNGIGPLTSPDKDPIAVADAMMPMIALNAVLFCGFIAAFGWAWRRADGANRRILSYGIAVAGALIWFLVAWLITPLVAPWLPSPGPFAVLSLVATAAITFAIWSPRPTAETGAAAQRSFAAFWWTRRWRVLFFVVSLFALLAAAATSGAEWVGRLSALPLVPLSVLAGLAIDEPDALPQVRDPIFIGPALAMVFVWAFTWTLIPLQARGGSVYWVAGIASLAAGWSAFFLAAHFGMPALATALDRRRG
jgi:hypothetical protein